MTCNFDVVLIDATVQYTADWCERIEQQFDVSCQILRAPVMEQQLANYVASGAQAVLFIVPAAEALSTRTIKLLQSVIGLNHINIGLVFCCASSEPDLSELLARRRQELGAHLAMPFSQQLQLMLMFEDKLNVELIVAAIPTLDDFTDLGSFFLKTAGRISELCFVRASNCSYESDIGKVQLASSGALVPQSLRALPSGKLIQSEVAISDVSEWLLKINASDEFSDDEFWFDSQNPPEISDQFEAQLWLFGPDACLPGRTYRALAAGFERKIVITDLKYVCDFSTSNHLAAKVVLPSQVAVCNIRVDAALPVPSAALPLILRRISIVDDDENIIGLVSLNFPLRRASNIHRQAVDVNKQSRAQLLGQKPVVIWFTGLSGSGKSTIANALEKKLYALGKHTYMLDGDNVRHGLNKDLGFTDADRVENIRRIAEVAKLMVDAGLIVLTAFISPFSAERQMARDLLGENEFVEVFVNTPLAIAEQRDPKGLYKKAREGVLKNFTGIDSPYEQPEHAELVLDTANNNPEEVAQVILEYLMAAGYV